MQTSAVPEGGLRWAFIYLLPYFQESSLGMQVKRTQSRIRVYDVQNLSFKINLLLPIPPLPPSKLPPLSPEAFSSNFAAATVCII